MTENEGAATWGQHGCIGAGGDFDNSPLIVPINATTSNADTRFGNLTLGLEGHPKRRLCLLTEAVPLTLLVCFILWVYVYPAQVAPSIFCTSLLENKLN